jgi:AGZA family xanthine/uracil permease-like MFS transporter
MARSTPAASLAARPVVSPRREVLAGVTTFFAAAYIVAVNPSVLASEGTGMPFDGVLTATVLLCFSMTLLMGLYARLPFVVAPGMGLNAFFAYTLVIGQGIAWPTALGMVFWSGVLFLAVSATRLREWIAEAIPASLRVGLAAGIGLLLAFLGLRNAGIVVADPVTMVRAGPFGHEVAFTVIGLLVAVALLARRQPAALLVSIGVVTVLAWGGGFVPPPERWVGHPDFSSVFLRLDVIGALAPALIPAIVALLFTDLFDSLSTFVGVADATGLADDRGRPLRLREGLLVDALATLGAGLFGTSPGTAYVESAAGIDAGGRTGLTAVVTAGCFLPCLFIAPLVAAIPPYATAPVLILVGLTMFSASRRLPVGRVELLLPACLTIVLIPLTLSITQGVLWGLVAHAAAHLVAGRPRQVGVGGWVLAAVALGLLALLP